VTNLTAIANKSPANPSGSGGIQSQTLEANGTAYFGSQDGYEYAVNATTGHLLWSTFLGQDKNDTGCAAYYGTVGVVSRVDDVPQWGGLPLLRAERRDGASGMAEGPR
jgi:outer membrane protein assembly factor BamB